MFFNMLQKCIDMNIDNRISQVLFDSLASLKLVWLSIGVFYIVVPQTTNLEYQQAAQVNLSQEPSSASFQPDCIAIYRTRLVYQPTCLSSRSLIRNSPRPSLVNSRAQSLRGSGNRESLYCANGRQARSTTALSAIVVHYATSSIAVQLGKW